MGGPVRKLYVVLALLLVCTISEASKKYPVTASSAVPAAKGEVSVDTDKNGNMQVHLWVEHLANPQNLTPSASAYVVWVQDKNERAENKGQMKLDKNLKGTFETVTSAKSFDLFVTGEKDSNTKTPAGQEVLRTSVQQ
jgi:hypothetical protein